MTLLEQLKELLNNYQFKEAETFFYKHVNVLLLDEPYEELARCARQCQAEERETKLSRARVTIEQQSIAGIQRLFSDPAVTRLLLEYDNESFAEAVQLLILDAMDLDDAGQKAKRYRTQFMPMLTDEQRDTLQEAMGERVFLSELNPSARQYLCDRWLKCDYQEILTYIKDEQIERLYHFTDRANLGMIQREGGLRSRSYLLERGLRIPRPGGNELSWQLEEQNGRQLQNYIDLCFHPNQPMLYVAKNDGRLVDPVIIEIDPAVMLALGTLFSNINAVDSAAKIGSSAEDLARVHFQLFRCGRWKGEEEKKYFQAEVLVKDFIPQSLFLKIS